MSIFKKLFAKETEEAKFATLLIQRMCEAGDPRKVTFDEANFQLHFRQGKNSAGTANLRNIYTEYLQREAQHRDSYIQQAVRALLSPHKQIPAEFTDVKADLLLTVRARSYFAHMELDAWTNGHADFRWPHQPLGDYLAIGLVYDLPEAMMMVQQRQLDEWNVSFYEAFEAARDNLRSLPFSYAQIGSESYVSATNDNYDASRAAMPEHFRQLPVLGQHVMMVPNRDRLLVTGNDDDDGLELILTIAQESLSKEPRPMTGVAFCLDGDEWRPWVPPADHRLYAKFFELQTQWVGQDYAEQLPTLTKWCEAQGDPAYVASFSGVRRDEEPTISYCVWTDGLISLLPKTDLVMFYRPSEQGEGHLVAQARWAHVESVVGHLMRLEEFYPERYRVTEFPSANELKEIGNQLP